MINDKDVTRRWIAGLLVAIVSVPCGRALGDADELASGFLNPPDSAKPRTWWHWVSGNVSAEGITADLEAMKQIGLGGAQNFTVDQSDVHGPVKFMSQQWRDLVHHALLDANRLNLEMSMEGCDGWSESGGPWITPAESMQKIVWTERTVTGGQTVKLDLPQPETIRGYYEDVALIAFPTPPDEPPPPTSTSAFLEHKAGAAQWIAAQYSAPVTCQSIFVTTVGGGRKLRLELQASDDGQSFAKVADVHRQGITTFKPATGKCFRLMVGSLDNSAESIEHGQFTLAGKRIDYLSQRTGMAVDQHVNFFSTEVWPEKYCIDPKSIVDLTGKPTWDAPAGEWTVVRLGHTSTGVTTHPSTAAGLECDKLSAAAVTDQFNGMFGPVISDSPDLIGSTLKYVLLDSWEAGCENWTPKMPDDFKADRGYDLWPWLPVLTGRTVGDFEKTQQFLWDYRRTIADLLASNHYGTWHDMAHQHGMGLASEATGIGMPTVADQLQCKGHCDIPMGAFWVNRSFDDNIDDPKEAASAAHIYGQNIAATESFTSMPYTAAWKNDPQSLKQLGDFEFCQGVNRFVFHRYAHQPWMDRKPGMSMGPWGINFERTNTWWNQGAAWISYLSRCEYLLQRGRYVADVLYFYGEGAPVCLSHGSLSPAPPSGYSYDACSMDALLNHTNVDHGDIVFDSGMRYRVLVLPKNNLMTLPTLKKIESLVKAGATVYGPKPTHTPSLSGAPDDKQSIATIAGELWGDCDGKTITEHVCGAGKIVLGEDLQKAIAAPLDFESDAKGLLFIHRFDAATNADIYFISNQQNTPVLANCTFRVADKAPELWRPDTATMESPAIVKSENGRTTVAIGFDPLGSMFVIFRHPSDSASIASVAKDGQPLFGRQSSDAADLPQIDGGNVTMQAWQAGNYTIATATGQHATAIAPALPQTITIDGPWQVTFPPKLGAPASAAFDHLISWTESTDDGIKYFSGTADYTHDFSLPADFIGKDRRVWLDLGEVKNLAEVSVNGKSLGVLWKAPFRVEITDAVQPGNNHLDVKITNLWPNRLIGDQKLPEEKRITWTSVSLYKSDSPLLPSGLLGPVKIIPAVELTMAPGK